MAVLGIEALVGLGQRRRVDRREQPFGIQSRGRSGLLRDEEVGVGLVALLDDLVREIGIMARSDLNSSASLRLEPLNKGVDQIVVLTRVDRQRASTTTC